MIALIFVIVLIGATAEEFVKPLQCMNKDFDLDGYLEKQTQAAPVNQPGMELLMTTPSYPLDFVPQPVRTVMRFTSMFGAGHTWVSIQRDGKSCLQAALQGDAYDVHGCAPFSNVVKSLNNLKKCIQYRTNENPKGRWVSGTLAKLNFKSFQTSDYDRIMIRLAMLAGKDSNTWMEDNELKSIFNQEQLQRSGPMVRQCIKEALVEREDMKCYTVLMNAPGITGPTLFDHPPAPKLKPRVTTKCNVLPVCSRLAFEKLHHFQNARYDITFVQGIWKSWGIKNEKSWIMAQNGQPTVNQKCNINLNAMGPTICWNFSECAAAMLKVVCQEHPLCCPSVQVRDACKKDITSPECKVCESKSKWSSLFNNKKASNTKPTNAIKQDAPPQLISSSSLRSTPLVQ